MRILGLDPGSDYAGWASVYDGELDHAGFWRPSNAKDSAAQRLWEYACFIEKIVQLETPDLGVVEDASRSAQSITGAAVLARYEAAGMIALKRAKVPVIHLHVMTARSIVFSGDGGGGKKKEDILHHMRVRYPFHEWPAINRGGGDMADAVVLALAGPQAAER